MNLEKFSTCVIDRVHGDLCLLSNLFNMGCTLKGMEGLKRLLEIFHVGDTTEFFVCFQEKDHKGDPGQYGTKRTRKF